MHLTTLSPFKCDIEEKEAREWALALSLRSWSTLLPRERQRMKDQVRLSLELTSFIISCIYSFNLLFINARKERNSSVFVNVVIADFVNS